MAVLRAGARFGVILHAEGGLIGEFETAIATIEQAGVRGAGVGGKRIGKIGRASCRERVYDDV